MLNIQFGSSKLTDKSSSGLHITQGNLQHLKQGDEVRVFIPHINQGKANVTIQGVHVTLEGLDKTLEHKTITLRIIKAGIHPQLALQISITANTSTSTKTPLHKGEHKQSFSKTDVQHKAFHVQLTKASIPTWLSQNQQPFSATVSAHQGKQITLTVPANNHEHAKQQQLHIQSPHRSMQLGEQFHIRVASLNQNNIQLQLSPISSAAAVAPVNATAELSQPTPLAKGDIITAVVNERLTSEKIILQWQGKLWQADAPKYIQKGDMLQLEVQQTEKETTFRVLESISHVKIKAAQLLRQHLNKRLDQAHHLNSIRHAADPTKQAFSASAVQNPTTQLANALSNINNWIDHYTLHGNKLINSEQINQLFRHTGQHYESSLAQHRHDIPQALQHIKQHDLKALLQQLHQTTNLHPSAEIAHLHHTAEHAIANIESQQALNLLAMLQADPIRFELPMMVQGQLINVFLSIQQQQYQEENAHQDHKNASSHSILFALELTGLGALRIDAYINQSSVHARFYHSNDDSQAFVQSHLQRLEEKLQALGFNEVYLTTASDKKITPDQNIQFNQLINHIPSSDGLLDLKV